MRISDWSSDVCSSDLRVSKLESRTITDWMNKLASSPARLRTAKGADQNYREMVDSEEARRRRRSSTNRILTILKAALNVARSEEHTSELQSLMRISYAVFCLKKKKTTNNKMTQKQYE